MGRSPTATAIICERVGDLSGDRAADDRRYAELSSQKPRSRPDGSVSPSIAAHLARDLRSAGAGPRRRLAAQHVVDAPR